MKTSESETKLEGLGNRLLTVIHHLHITQSECARRLKSSPGFISDVVRGKKNPGADFLFGLREAFGVSIDWLLSGDGLTSSPSEPRGFLLQDGEVPPRECSWQHLDRGRVPPRIRCKPILLFANLPYLSDCWREYSRSTSKSGLSSSPELPRRRYRPAGSCIPTSS